MDLSLPSAGDTHVVFEAMPFPPFLSSGKFPPVPVMMIRQGAIRESSVSDSRYFHFGSSSRSSRSSLRGIDSKFSLSPYIGTWGPDAFDDCDDELHRPDDRDHNGVQYDGKLISRRGLINLGCFIFVCAGLITLLAGYPMATPFTPQFTRWGKIATNATGQIPGTVKFGLIDKDTPTSVYNIPSYKDGRELVLVFSDEFNEDGRTFYPGDDPYWEAVDLHYWATNNMEWYDPEAVTTSDGSLVITLSQKKSHHLNYQGGMIQTWNKLCFTGGYIEANVSLPGVTDVAGFWPAIWTMGNLGRAGYGASLDGMWPYTYDSCDVGTLPHQILDGLPAAATVNGSTPLSYLPGQRLSRCTCDGESHPGPKHNDGTFAGRGAPEIDVFEGQNTGQPIRGLVSQTAQWAPFNHEYIWENTTANMYIADFAISQPNDFIGGPTQQATSVITQTDQNCYEGSTGCFSVYGFEYKPGFDDAYISWVSDSKLTWTILAAGVGPDPLVEISSRPVPQEPMYIIINLGMSESFGPIDLEHLPLPVHMRVDYIRVYQPKGEKNVGCDPPDFPTEAYVNQYIDAYIDPGLTTWVDDYHQTVPRNSLLGQC